MDYVIKLIEVGRFIGRAMKYASAVFVGYQAKELMSGSDNKEKNVTVINNREVVKVETSANNIIIAVLLGAILLLLIVIISIYLCTKYIRCRNQPEA